MYTQKKLTWAERLERRGACHSTLYSALMLKKYAGPVRVHVCGNNDNPNTSWGCPQSEGLAVLIAKPPDRVEELSASDNCFCRGNDDNNNNYYNN